MVKDGTFVAVNTPIEKRLTDGELVYQSLKELGLLGEDLGKVIRVKVGDEVSQNSVLAVATGLFGLSPITIKASHTGVVESISLSTGHVAIRTPAREILTRAPISGIIHLVDAMNIRIDSYGLLVQGLFGIGQRDFGLAKKYEKAEDINLEDPDCEVVILRNSPDVATLRMLKDNKKALITGSLNSDVLDSYLGYELGIPVTGHEQIKPAIILTEGFGEQPMSSFDLISEGLVSFDPTTQVRCGAVRPFLFTACNETEIRSHLSSKQAKKNQDSEGSDENNNHLKLGSSVRIIRGEHYGLSGEVIELPTAPHTFPSGVKVAIAVIKAKDNHNIPLQNLELIDSSKV